MTLLPENEVQLWYFKVDEFLKDVESYANLLSLKETARADSFKFDKDRTVYILARGLLRILSGRYLNKIPKKIKFDYGEYGKPGYKFQNPIAFNISHSGNMIVMAFARNCEIGVDIEKIKDDFDVIDIAHHFFSPDEIQTLKALPEQEQVYGFYRCWTRKESFIKAKGSGLSFPLTSFSVSLDVDYAELLRTDWDSTEKKEWQLFTFTTTKDYLGALSVKGNVESIRQMKWHGS
ncbi:4'-phosphopantetheinyl transferase [Pricia antarctica]|uniref:4'-phosphopantetheinyl transferase n=1 Tax=Pricia antarctica TaxID=641691 RepID=A0A1G7FSV5_9FLAO|nr:4'-phosphopantetheinyl transferase superfamily protein [Pricia antarctica]SDE78974.1 4'-phosphopantetheinyl transferase [Pricia antarctica]